MRAVGAKGCVSATQNIPTALSTPSSQALRKGARPNLPGAGGLRPIEALGDAGAQGKAKEILAKYGGCPKGSEKAKAFKDLPDFASSGAPVSRVEDRSNVPDSKACAECGLEFGTITNRRFLCNSSKLWVRDGCSSKKVDGARVSDSSYNLLRAAEIRKREERERRVLREIEEEVRELNHRGVERCRATNSLRADHRGSLLASSLQLLRS